MLPLLFLALAVASDRTGGRKTAFREAPLSAWCRCQGEACSSKKDNFGGLLSGLDFLFASEGEKKFRLEMARQSAMSLPAHLSRILKMKPREGAEFVIKAETWPTYAPLSGLDPIPGPFEGALKALNDPSDPSVLRSSGGNLALVSRTLKAMSPLPIHIAMDEEFDHYSCDPDDDWIHGEVRFDAPVNIPILFERKEGGSWVLWMSHTPNEVFTQISHIRTAARIGKRAKAEGKGIHVVIGGLGIGWILTEVAKLPGIARITVIERNQALADFILPKICGLIPKRVQIDVRIGDLFESTAGLEKADLMLLDIWPKYGDVTEDLVRIRDAGMEMTVRVWGWVE